jgi:cytochrome c-type biogenesis protein CcmH/NrfF
MAFWGAALLTSLLALQAGAELGAESGAESGAEPTAQLDAESARRAHRLASDLMSPYCPGRTLADCPSPDATALRNELRALLDGGVPEQEVRAQLAQRFGGAISGVPRTRLGWVLPGIALVLGALGLAIALHRLLRAPRGGAAEPPVSDPELEAQLDAELERMR